MRILQVTPYFGEHYGGTERYCYNLTRALVNLDHEVHVYAARINPSTPRREVKDGIIIHRFPTPTIIWNINPLPIMLHRLLTKRFDIIHAHSYLYFSSNQALLGKILRNLVGKHAKLIMHLHGGLGIPPYLDQHPLKKVAKHVYDATIGKTMMLGSNHILSACKSDAIIAQEQFSIPNSKISIVYNAIDPYFFKNGGKEGNEKQEPYILFVGDLERWKGIKSLIQALNILRTRGENYRMKIAGIGSLRRTLQNMADGLDVEFLGAVPHSQIPRLMRSAFAFVLPSYWEGIPTVGIEAMASGTPFIGTDIGGIPELVTHDVTGLLIHPNAPWEIADSIQRLQNKKLRQRLTENAAKLISEKFSVQAVAKRTLEIYDKVINDR